MKILVINIGNTNTQYGIYSGGEIRDVKYVPTAEFMKNHKRIPELSSGLPIAVSTVVPAAKKALPGKNVFWVGPSAKLPVSLKKVDSSTLGADRIANIAAVAKSAKLPAIVIDFGTAVTVDAVNGKREFLGGAILPGRMLLRKCLNDFTAQLPLVALSEKKPKALGRNTKDAILSGTDLAVLGSVKEIISRIKIEMNVKKCMVTATGGDAGFFMENMKGLKFGGKALTLLGIAACWEAETSSPHK
ncbi:MAG: type III pantothenate kinase [Victivallales bacterium]|jgi:type III pantothenate kinase